MLIAIIMCSIVYSQNDLNNQIELKDKKDIKKFYVKLKDIDKSFDYNSLNKNLLLDTNIIASYLNENSEYVLNVYNFVDEHYLSENAFLREYKFEILPFQNNESNNLDRKGSGNDDVNINTNKNLPDDFPVLIKTGNAYEDEKKLGESIKAWKIAHPEEWQKMLNQRKTIINN